MVSREVRPDWKPLRATAADIRWSTLRRRMRRRVTADADFRQGMPLVCALCGEPQELGARAVDAHHVIPQRRIRSWVDEQVHDGAIKAADRPSTLRRLLSDPRNRIPLCRPCHDGVERRKIALSGDLIPDAWSFAREIGMEWWLERFTEQAALDAQEDAA